MKVRIKCLPKAQNGSDESNEPINPMKLALLESGEVYKDDEGDFKKIPDSAPTHDDKERGVVVDDAHQVLNDTSDKRNDIDSKLLKLLPEDVLNLTGVKVDKSMTHSKAFEKAGDYWDSKIKSYTNKLKTNFENAKETDNPFANNSLLLNVENMKHLPTRQQIFDNLFNHQEQVKQKYQIDSPSKTYRIGGTPNPLDTEPPYTSENTPSNYGSNDLLEKFKQSTGASNIDEAQQYWVKNFPNLVIADYRNNPKNHATNAHAELAKKYNGDYTKLTDDEILNGYHDKLWGNRAYFRDAQYPKTMDEYNSAINGKKKVSQNGVDYYYSDNEPNTFNIINKPMDDSRQKDDLEEVKTTPSFTQSNTSPSLKPINNVPVKQISTNNTQPQVGLNKKFNEPLRWYDVAGDIMGLLDSSNRIPAKYNPAKFNEIDTHLIDPRPALQEGTADYNAALKTLPDNNIGYANSANVFSKKYGIDNKILGDTENINKGKLDNRDMYNAQVRDKQSASDQESRARFEQQRLGSLEAQRKEKMTALQDMFDKVAQNHALNRNGNLMMQMFDYFDQNGNYNGKKYDFRLPNNVGNNQVNSTEGELASSLDNWDKLSPKEKDNFIFRMMKLKAQQSKNNQ